MLIGVALALTGAVVGTAAGATTPFQQVLVVNPPASPIPVIQQGSVSISNLPANQSVTVSNFPATQPVSGTVSVTPLVANKNYASNAIIELGEDHDFIFPSAINVSALTVSSGDSLLVTMTVVGTGAVTLHNGEGFSRDFTVPVPATRVSVRCRNSIADCFAVIAVFGF
jgi:hypothetical protein